MLAALIFTITLSATCPPTELVGFEDGMTEDDKTNMESSRKRCGEIYPDSPCLKKFVKCGELNYWAICGGEQK